MPCDEIEVARLRGKEIERKFGTATRKVILLLEVGYDNEAPDTAAAKHIRARYIVQGRYCSEVKLRWPSRSAWVPCRSGLGLSKAASLCDQAVDSNVYHGAVNWLGLCLQGRVRGATTLLALWLFARAAKARKGQVTNGLSGMLDTGLAGLELEEVSAVG